jgi:ATP-dependent exoDNAse (exonuclease V) beta subunit
LAVLQNENEIQKRKIDNQAEIINSKQKEIETKILKKVSYRFDYNANKHLNKKCRRKSQKSKKNKRQPLADVPRQRTAKDILLEKPIIGIRNPIRVKLGNLLSLFFVYVLLKISFPLCRS